MSDVVELLHRSPVIPVASIRKSRDAVPLAEALLAGGVDIIEVTLRTDTALDAIAEITRELPDMCVGVGTAWTAADAKSAIEAGARFVVTPGRSDPVYETCAELGVPLLPGTQTATEIALWVERGLTAVKFFPAATAGGVAALKAFSAVFPGLLFCPTGGISTDNAPDYLALAAVPCVGGSWLADAALIERRDWGAIQGLAAQAAALNAARGSKE